MKIYLLRDLWGATPRDPNTPEGLPLRLPLALCVLALLGPALAMAEVRDADYPWLPSMTERVATQRLDARFPTPDGFTRVAAADGSFAAWLRGLPVRTDRSNVLAYDGSRLMRPSAAVVLLDVGKRDLQQCADSAIRLHAEWQWHRGKAKKAAYHFTSGDKSRFADWARGERFKIKGNKVERVRGKARGSSWRSYRRWLSHTFRYAGTQSLWRDSREVGKRPIEAGDFYVQPGGPGHAVVVLDVAEAADGRRAALIGQGFMPAEDFHVLQDSHDRVIDGVWFLLPDAAHPSVKTPSWSAFEASQARRFK